MSFDVDNFVERNYTEEDVYEDIEGEDLYLLVHPGFGLQNDEYKELGITETDHLEYSMELFSEFEMMADSSFDIAVLKEVGTDYSREFLGPYAEEVDHWFETQRGNSKLLYRNADEFIDLVTSMDEDSTMVISGEHRNLCEGQARQIVNFLSAEKDLSINLERGVTFPERPLRRDENMNLRFA
jgi:hypothetical protein